MNYTESHHFFLFPLAENSQYSQPSTPTHLLPFKKELNETFEQYKNLKYEVVFYNSCSCLALISLSLFYLAQSLHDVKSFPSSVIKF